jgi:hypothetical protein
MAAEAEPELLRDVGAAGREAAPPQQMDATTTASELVLCDVTLVELILLHRAADEFATAAAAAVAGKAAAAQTHDEQELELAVAVAANAPDLAGLAALATVSRAFVEAFASDFLWRPLCHSRWRSKWGFAERWARALREVRPSGWQQRYRVEEQDGERQRITVHELHTLVFDFRFWLGQQPARGRTHGGLPFVPAGVRSTSGEAFRFNPHNPATKLLVDTEITTSGAVSGHPSGRTDLVW